VIGDTVAGDPSPSIARSNAARSVRMLSSDARPAAALRRRHLCSCFANIYAGGARLAVEYGAMGVALFRTE